MIPLCVITAAFDGRRAVYQWQIPADAHPLGVAPAVGKHSRIFVGAYHDLEGAEKIYADLRICADGVFRELRGAWDTQPLW